MKRKIKNLVKILLVVAILLFIHLNLECYAINPTQQQLTDGGTGRVTGSSSASSVLGGNFNEYKAEPEDDPAAAAAIGKIVGVIRLIGTIVSVGTIMLIGIGYMVGGIEAKVDYKKTMMPYIIGCLILFAGSQFVQIIYDIAHAL